MKKNGFTLIELLAVIVILAIIALIATPIILGIINDAREKANERSVELYASAVKNGIAAYQLVEGKEVKPDTYTKETLPFTVDYDGNVECTSIIISEDSKVSLTGCKVNAGEREYSYGQKEEHPQPACALDDKDGDGVASLSDVVTCGTESFYVMFNKNNEIIMLSMFSLYVGNFSEETPEGIIATPLTNPTNKQSEITTGDLNYGSFYGSVVFSNKYYWVDESWELLPEYGTEYPAWIYNDKADIYPYVSEYERILKEELKVNSASATLISVEQLKKLGCSFDDYYGYCSAAPSWVTSTSYWTGNGCEMDDGLHVVSKASQGVAYIDADFKYAYGVRPVIIISTSDIK